VLIDAVLASDCEASLVAADERWGEDAVGPDCGCSIAVVLPTAASPMAVGMMALAAVALARRERR